MKTLFYPLSFLLAFTLSQYAFSKNVLDPIFFPCRTQPATSTYQMTETKDGYRLDLVHHNGVEYIPVHLGMATYASLSKIESRAKELMKMGSFVQIYFQKDDCSHKNLSWKCYSKRPLQVGELKAEGVSFKTFDKSTQVEDYEFQNVDVHLSFRQRKNHIQYDLTSSFVFAKEDCKVHNR